MNKQVSFVRCLIANAVNLPPDDIEIVFVAECVEETLFQVDYGEYGLVVGGFNKESTIGDVLYTLDEIYNSISSWEEDNDESI
jgi:hypothetical protein